eukprot:TRINITY_DN15038_c0_g1_i1.p1 TRINITY_DN15038_c0_g1~~TRINITY_DN15038_c0_g1_i1.p1  ORF type:complete len:251 (+),score=42.76 TRINITY_DN15038_c0_g1_i1:51-755(+)
MAEARAGCSAVAFGDRIYVMGGYPLATNSVAVLDPDKGLWVSTKSMLESRWRSAAAVVSQRICVVGGISVTGGMLDSAECFDPQQPEAGWCYLPSLTSPRWGCAATAFAGQLCVFGGFQTDDDSVPATSAEALRITAPDSWRMLPPMRAERGMFAVVTIPQAVDSYSLMNNSVTSVLAHAVEDVDGDHDATGVEAETTGVEFTTASDLEGEGEDEEEEEGEEDEIEDQDAPQAA